MTLSIAIVLARPGAQGNEAAGWLSWLVPVLLVVGTVHLVRALKRRRLLTTLDSGLRPVRDLDATAGTVVVNGTVVTDDPLVSPITRTPCVFFTYEVEEEWAVEWDETADVPHQTGLGRVEHREVTRRRRKTDTTVVASDQRATPFVLRDATGEVVVDPDRADVTWERSYDDVVDRSSPMYDVPGARHLRKSTGLRRLQEGVVPVGAEVTVVGPVQADEGEPRIRWGRRRRPTTKRPFLVSVQGPDDLARAVRRDVTRRWLVAAGCLLAAIGITVYVSSVTPEASVSLGHLVQDPGGDDGGSLGEPIEAGRAVEVPRDVRAQPAR